MARLESGGKEAFVMLVPMPLPPNQPSSGLGASCLQLLFTRKCHKWVDLKRRNYVPTAAKLVEYEPRNGGRLCVATTTYYSMPTTSSCDMFPRRAKSNHIRDCHNDCKKRNLFSSITASEEKMQFSMAKVIKLDIDHQFSPFPSITNGVYGATIPSSQILLIYG